MADGYLGKCKVCAKKDVNANRDEKCEYYRDYDRKRGNRQTAEDLARYRAENPKKWAAHQAVGQALRKRKLLKGPCECCGVPQVEGHHDDYDKPLVVRWLCPAHHKQWHKENGEGLNG